jgi:poly(A) polymerase
LVTGHDLIALGLPPGKTIGRILAQLEEEQLEGKLTDKASALARARTLL